MIRNMMSCTGFETGVMGPCSQAWLIMGLLFLIVIVSRKQIEDFLGWDYNLLGGFIGAFAPYLILVTLFGWIKWGLLAGLVGSFVGGMMIGQVLGGGGGSDYD